MLTPSGPLLGAARAGSYAVGAFNVASLEAMAAIVDAAEAEQAPVLAMIWSGVVTWLDFDALAKAVVFVAERSTVPVAVHLDHGEDLEIVRRALGLGFSSVMYDGARHPLRENIRLTQQARELAHACGATLEAEIGEIGAEREDDGDLPPLSEVAETIDFWDAARPDVLAVAIGSQHGRYRVAPDLDLARLEAIADRIPAPLSLHGGSYTPDDQIRGAIARGIAKINIASELEQAFLDSIAGIDLKAARYISDVTDPGYTAVGERIREKIRLFGSTGRAVSSSSG